MTYTEMIDGIMQGKKAKLSYWGDEKYLFVIREWRTDSHENKTHVPFIAIVDGNVMGPAILHNCDMFKDDWELF